MRGDTRVLTIWLSIGDPCQSNFRYHLWLVERPSLDERTPIGSLVVVVFCYKKIHPLIKIESELVQLIKFGDNRETTTLFLIVICNFNFVVISTLYIHNLSLFYPYKPLTGLEPVTPTLPWWCSTCWAKMALLNT